MSHLDDILDKLHAMHCGEGSLSEQGPRINIAMMELAALRSVRAATIEECARRSCHLCDLGWPFDDPERPDMHFGLTDKTCFAECSAKRIRSLSSPKGGK